MKRISVFVMLLVINSFLLSSCRENDRLLSVDRKGRTVVERFGQLRVEGTYLLAADGKPVQLRGISSYGLQYAGKYANEEVLRWLRDDWNMQIWRAALYLSEGGYITQPSIKSKVIDSVEAALKLGLYVIIDWHVHMDQDPRMYQRYAIEFFAEMAQRYGSYPNVLYEICNEPNGRQTTWGEAVKPYAEAVIAEIRKYDPDNIIIVGTPTWSQDVDIAAGDPIQGINIMYTLHFYAGTHGEELRRKAQTAIDKGLALFVTECGTSQATGGGGVFEEKFLEWLSFLKKHQISWVNWSLTNKGEDSGILIMNADREGKGHWTENELSQSGKFIRGILRNEVKVK
ncbi:MAG: glycoside hydrolase family 5 protein [Spirochaetes bacterium]|nr:glycoside hydrolase family 5 protein [Brevinematales bacterium]MCL1959189.1 glycoside hydrolase family 5 protein [Spirochaetota bacterium]